MRYALFLGCTVPARAVNYEMATRRVARELGIEFIDINGFACCGFPLKAVSEEAASLLAVRNLSLAEEENLDICAICSACTSVLTETNKRFKEDREYGERINSKLKGIKRTYRGRVKVKHFTRILYEEVRFEEIKKRVVQDLGALKFGVHYGCHYLKPSSIYDRFEDPEDPKSLDDLIQLTGASSLEYEDKKECCGGGILSIDEEVALSIAKEKLERMTRAQPAALVLICPFCNIMYEANQRKMESKFRKTYNLPVLYYPQVLGLSMGIAPRELGLYLNIVKTEGLLKQIGKGA